MIRLKCLLSTFVLTIIFIQFATSQWEAQAPGFPENIAPVYTSVVNENIVWVLGGHEVDKTPYPGFSRTTDGGDSWTVDSIEAEDLGKFRFGSVFALNDQVAWVTMVDDITFVHRGRIFKTTNGGVTWVHQSSAFPDDEVIAHMPASVHFFDENNGLVVGYYGEHYTTSNGGTQWDLVPDENVADIIGNEKPMNSNIWSINDSTAWYGTDKGRIYRTTDKGYSWEAFDVGLGESMVFVSFKDHQNGYATTPLINKNIAQTTNGGGTWQILDTELPINSILVYLKGTKNTHMYASGDLPIFISSDPGNGFSLDDGNSWLFESDVPLDPMFTASSSVGWAVGSTYDEKIYKWTGPNLDSLDQTSGIEELLSGNNSGEINLSQNYPNPFNRYTSIDYELENNSKVSLTIHDISGKEIKTLVKSNQNAGKYTVRLDAHDFSPGIYLYKLKTGNTIQSRKMIVFH